MAGSTSDSSLHPVNSLQGSSPLVPVSSRNRRGSMVSGESPLRARRSSLSTNQPPSPHLPLAAAASVNASMRNGSLGPADTARDTVNSRRKSVVAELVMADDSLPPAAEIATGDRKGSIAEGLHNVPNLSLRDSALNSSSVNPSPFTDRPRGSLSGSPSLGFPDPFHKRTPSVGEVHQQMEQEQEAQVNRLLLQIHQQQVEIDALKRQIPPSDLFNAPSTSGSDGISQSGLTPTGTPAMNPMRPPPTPDRAHSSGSASSTTASTMPAARLSPSLMPVSRPPRSASPMSLGAQQRSSSRGNSRPASPSTKSRAQSSYLETDETKHWQAEASNLEKENMLLKQRVRELEKQLRTLNSNDDAVNTAPHRSSSLATEPMSIDG